MSLLDTASLIVTPNGYKEGKLYSVIPSDGSGDMSVVRATTATRVNSAGLVELVPYNLLSYSEQFDNAYWINNGVTITANTTTAPDGTLTADRLTGVSGGFGVVRFSTWSATNNAASCFAKKNTSNIFRISNVSGAIGGVNFDLNSGVVSSVSSGFSASIEDFGNGWYRCTAIDTLGRTGTFSLGVTSASESVFIWGAQLNEGTILPYQKTETRLNIPRLDYSNGTCPSLLVEPQRTNLALYSSSFDNVIWGKSKCTISANQTTSPDGTTNADKLIEDSSTGLHEVYSTTPFSLTVGVAYTKTIYAKSSERTQISLNFVTSGFSQGASVIANLTTGTLGTVNNVGGVTGSTATITNVGNGWYRISITMTPASTANFYADFSTALNGAINYTGNGTSGIFIWGAQLEVGSYPTSYIPTTSASVTRNADVISKTGISSLIGQTEGVVFTDFICDGFEDYGTPLSINDGTASNYIWLTTFANGNIRAEVYNGSVQASITYTGGVVGQRYKVAFAYKQNDFVMYVNGTQIGADASGNVPPSLSRIDYNLVNNWSLALLNVNASALWKTRLTNTQLAQLTTI